MKKPTRSINYSPEESGKLRGSYLMAKSLGLIDPTSMVGKHLEKLFREPLTEGADYREIEPHFEGGEVRGYVVWHRSQYPDGMSDPIVDRKYIRKEDVEKL